ncbi:MAG: AtzE family amidohydrolase [Candidatus Solibacter usitatus]|nr:AtzE family amidohydrolase [Candidatus Solibacter usitatus]
MTSTQASFSGAAGLARAVRGRSISAVEATRAALRKIDRYDRFLNCFTAVLRESALARAADIDRRLAAGEDPGPLCGVPFAVKNLFDIEGLTTIAGSKIHAERPPAARDSTVVERLKGAGAIAIGALNMDEYAYGFTTENSHYGPTRNPHDPERVAGGSSGGSAAAVAADLVPLTAGSDTNGSIRVPAAFCGVFGLKPTYGRISRAGAFLFCESFDHVGPFARSVEDLALAFDVLHGPDPRDPVCSTRPPEPMLPQLERGIDGLRIAVLDGYFTRLGMPEVFAPVAAAARALGVTRTVTVPDVEAARASAYVITACEGSNLHFHDLRTRPRDFDPVVLDRFLAGALLPAGWYQHAQRFRTVFRAKMRELFQSVDILLAPVTPSPAIRIGQPTITLDGVELPSRPNIGVFTQPLSSIGLPIVAAPVFSPGSLPVGVQIAGAPYNEAAVLRVARYLEKMGVASAPVANGYQAGGEPA